MQMRWGVNNKDVDVDGRVRVIHRAGIFSGCLLRQPRTCCMSMLENVISLGGSAVFFRGPNVMGPAREPARASLR